jgi:hypothetical protein
VAARNPHERVAEALVRWYRASASYL